MAKKVPGVPAQHSGGYHDTESVQKFGSSAELNSRFTFLREIFFNINSWSTLSPKLNFHFSLCDASGLKVNRQPKIGDYIKISPAKFDNAQSQNHLWVRIDMLDQSNPESIMMQIRPSKIPGSEYAGRIMHFFASTSTCTFIVSKGKDHVKFGIYGRNEKANYDTNFINTFRNIFIAMKGRMGSSAFQWKNLADGLMLHQ